MATKVYGHSDDLVEFEGDIHGEVGCFGTDDRHQGVFIAFDDGTILEVKYGKGQMAIWGITVIKTGSFFDRIQHCEDEEAELYSDIVFFKDGLKMAWAAKEWERVF